MNQQVNNAIGGYEEKEQNGGDEPSGDASKEGGNFSADVGKLAERTSPTYTREEISALIAKKMCDYAEYYSYNTDGMADAALDALIAIGAVRVECK